MVDGLHPLTRCLSQLLDFTHKRMVETRVHHLRNLESLHITKQTMGPLHHKLILAVAVNAHLDRATAILRVDIPESFEMLLLSGLLLFVSLLDMGLVSGEDGCGHVDCWFRGAGFWVNKELGFCFVDEKYVGVLGRCCDYFPLVHVNNIHCAT